MLPKLDDLARSDLIVVAVGLLIALAAYELVKVSVENLFMPLLFLLAGQTEFPFLSFGIDGVTFPYGFVVGAALAFVIVCSLGIPLWNAQRRFGGESATRDCPECLTPIPSAAKRCPECTAAVTPDTAA